MNLIRHKNKKLILFVVVFLFIITPIFFVKATDPILSAIEGCRQTGTCGFMDFLMLGRSLFQWFLKWVSVFALMMLVVAGILWITSGGNQERIAVGKRIFIGTLIGIFIVYLSWSMVNLVICGLQGQSPNKTCTLFGKPWNVFLTDQTAKEIGELASTNNFAHECPPCLGGLGEVVSKKVTCASQEPEKKCTIIPIELIGEDIETTAGDAHCVLTAEEAKQAIEAAINTWNRAGARVNFVIQNQGRRVTFAYGKTLCGPPDEDGSYNFACAGEWDPQTEKNILKINTNHLYGIRSTSGCPSGRWINFQAVITHELGHVLGYILQPGDPNYDPDDIYHLHNYGQYYEELRMRKYNISGSVMCQGSFRSCILKELDRMPICRKYGERSSDSCPSGYSYPH